MKRIMYVVNNIDYFISHRRCLAEAASQAGYKVIVASPHRKGSDLLRDTDWQHVYFPLSRSGLWPIQEVRSLIALNRLIRTHRPDLLHLVTIKPVIYGGLLAPYYPDMSVVSAVTGLGYVFTGEQWSRRLLRTFIGCLYRFALRSQKLKVIFQNRDDQALFRDRGWIRPDQSVLIYGAGVCPRHYPLLAEPSARQPIVVLPARLLKDKGVQEFIAAARQLKSKATFALVGDVDVGNRASLSRQDLEAWVGGQIIEWWGWCDDMVDVFRRCHIVCLPSYREGLPRVLVEAACCGRAIVTTDVPGCREVVSHREDGLLVPAGEVGPLVSALDELISDAKLRQRLGQSAREKAVARFSEKVVVEETLALYRSLMPATTAK